MLTPLEKQLTEALRECVTLLESQSEFKLRHGHQIAHGRHALTAAEARERETVAAAGIHAPAPWEACQEGHNDAGFPAWIVICKDAAACRVYSYAEDSQPGRAEATARLIARAPAMDAALRRLLRAFEADKEKAPTLDILTCWETNSQAIAQAQAALA